MDIEDINGGLRALLFCCAFISATFFFGEIRTAWSLVCSIWHGRWRSHQFVGLAAFGWVVGALGSMIFTFPRLYKALIFGRSPRGLTHGWESVWNSAGFYCLAVGFFLPVFAALCYRRAYVLAFGLGIGACLFGIMFSFLAATLPTR